MVIHAVLSLAPQSLCSPPFLASLQVKNSPCLATNSRGASAAGCSITGTSVPVTVTSLVSQVAALGSSAEAVPVAARVAATVAALARAIRQSRIGVSLWTGRSGRPREDMTTGDCLATVRQ
jgi:hypothetical protein